MTRWLAVTLALSLFLPVAQAGTDTDNYVTGGGVYTDTTGGFMVFLCPDRHTHCDFDGQGGRDIPFGIGWVQLSDPGGAAHNLIVSVSDDMYGSRAAISACAFDPEGETPDVCSPPEDVLSDVSCGTVALLGIPWQSSRTIVGMWTFYVAEDLEFCGATSGTVTADFF